MLMAPNTGKRGEKRIEGGDELDARQGVDSSAHLKLEEDTVLTAGTASRRGTRLSSNDVMLPNISDLWHPSGRCGYATAQDAPSARERGVRFVLVELDLDPAPQFGVEQPVDDEDRPFDPPDLAQRQGKIVLARIGGSFRRSWLGGWFQRPWRLRCAAHRASLGSAVAAPVRLR